MSNIAQEMRVELNKPKQSKIQIKANLLKAYYNLIFFIEHQAHTSSSEMLQKTTTTTSERHSINCRARRRRRCFF